MASRIFQGSFKIAVSTKKDGTESLVLKRADEGRWNADNVDACLLTIVEKQAEWKVPLDVWSFRFKTETDELNAKRKGPAVQLSPEKILGLIKQVVSGKLQKTIRVYPDKFGKPQVVFMEPLSEGTEKSVAKPKREA